MTRKGLRKFRIKTKILTAFLGLPLVSQVVLGFITLKGITSLNSYSSQSGQALGIVIKIHEAVAAFSGGQPQFGDTTLMIMKVT